MNSKNKLAIINAVPYGSTGKIARSVATLAEQNNYETFLYYSWTKNYQKSDKSNIMVGSFLGRSMHMLCAKFTGKQGCYTKRDTKKLVKQLEAFSPDIIHLHILHSWSINLPILFDYIKKNNVKVVWTFHDCWAFTGHCPYFQMVKCDKWKTHCHDCPQYKDYPSAYVDKTRKMYDLKKEWFTGVKNMTIVTPSQWLADLVKQSFLKEYPVKVINNGIDLNVFKPTESDFRKKHNLEDKKVVLGVAFGWGVRKGLDVFIELSKRLPDNYKIVLVGTDESVDKQLPSNILSIHRTQNQKELAEIYSAADVFVNPTREEVFGLVNVEALACAIPVISFRTGGCPEIIDENTGLVIDVDNVDLMEKEIIKACENDSYSGENCIARAKAFDQYEKFETYIKLFDAMVEKN